MPLSWFGGNKRSKAKNTPYGTGDLSEYIYFNNASNTKTQQAVTPDTAKALPVYFACIRLISEDCAKLPIDVYRKRGDVKEPANQEIEDILNFKPNPYMNAISFRELLTGWALGWGVGLAEIQKNKLGSIVNLWPIHPSRVSYSVESDGSVLWEVSNDDNTKVVIKNEDIFKINGFGDNGITGHTAAQIGSESIGRALSQQDYLGAFYTNGGTLSGILEVAGKLDGEGANRIRSSWAKIYGGASNAHKIAVLEQGTKFTPVSILPADAQFIETCHFTIEDVCRWFRVAPHKVQHLLRSTNNNIESQNIDHATDTLHPWAVRWEQEIINKLLNTGERAKMSFAELLRGDNVSRANYLREMFNSGAMSPDDIRVYEGLNPRNDGRGGEYFTPVNMMTPTERDNAKAQTQPGEVVKTKVAAQQILKPFAVKEMKAVQKCEDGKKFPSGFFESNILQMQQALSGIINVTDIINSRELYLTGYRVGGLIPDSVCYDTILADLMRCFNIGDAN